ncbi:hypothetical protein Nepgr_032226 [Nepenthes gracilis]|uniref:Uncharacterized protein n=1 Tax=Nepenthes gracilis TaxID=150966 RepID=A0AAD3TK16_NEPGR|nr:hypothetical protein Nepgr_032226 [Nepenthes gracilis]
MHLLKSDATRQHQLLAIREPKPSQWMVCLPEMVINKQEPWVFEQLGFEKLYADKAIEVAAWGSIHASVHLIECEALASVDCEWGSNHPDLQSCDVLPVPISDEDRYAAFGLYSPTLAALLLVNPSIDDIVVADRAHALVGHNAGSSLHLGLDSLDQFSAGVFPNPMLVLSTGSKYAISLAARSVVR